MSETQTFLATTVRSNSHEVLASWWNTLRSAGLRLEQILGSSVTVETQQTITDNVSATSVTGLLLAAATIVRAKIQISTYRTDGTNTRTHLHEFWAIYNAKKVEWRMGSLSEEGEDCTSGACTSIASGVTFTITSGGQVQYATDSMGGTYVGKMRWKITSSFDLET